MLKRTVSTLCVVVCGSLLLTACGAAKKAPKSSAPSTPKQQSGQTSSGKQTSTGTTSGKTAKTSNPYPWRSHVHNPYLPGDVLIADAANNRILIVNPEKQIVWQYPPKGQKSNFPIRDPDDGFFTDNYKEIITNEESANTVAIINFKQKKIVWTYGHYGVAGSAKGYLNTPDDAFYYPKKNVVTVADIKNERILTISRKTKQILRQYGTTGRNYHNPPKSYAAPNGDFPAPNGGMLVTEINGSYLDLLSSTGRLIWTRHVVFPHVKNPYPSDANYTPGGNIIVASYTYPGEIVKISPSGKLLWDYFVKSGAGMLRDPSLAAELPNGMILVNDDGRDRVILIDPKTNKIVWQYGHTDQPGSKPGYLHEPDGTDFLPAGITPGG